MSLKSQSSGTKGSVPVNISRQKIANTLHNQTAAKNSISSENVKMYGSQNVNKSQGIARRMPVATLPSLKAEHSDGTSSTSTQFITGWSLTKNSSHNSKKESMNKTELPMKNVTVSDEQNYIDRKESVVSSSDLRPNWAKHSETISSMATDSKSSITNVENQNSIGDFPCLLPNTENTSCGLVTSTSFGSKDSERLSMINFSQPSQYIGLPRTCTQKTERKLPERYCANASVIGLLPLNKTYIEGEVSNLDKCVQINRIYQNFDPITDTNMWSSAEESIPPQHPYQIIFEEQEDRFGNVSEDLNKEIVSNNHHPSLVLAPCSPKPNRHSNFDNHSSSNVIQIDCPFSLELAQTTEQTSDAFCPQKYNILKKVKHHQNDETHEASKLIQLDDNSQDLNTPDNVSTSRSNLKTNKSESSVVVVSNAVTCIKNKPDGNRYRSQHDSEKKYPLGNDGSKRIFLRRRRGTLNKKNNSKEFLSSNYISTTASVLQNLKISAVIQKNDNQLEEDGSQNSRWRDAQFYKNESYSPIKNLKKGSNRRNICDELGAATSSGEKSMQKRERTRSKQTPKRSEVQGPLMQRIEANSGDEHRLNAVSENALRMDKLCFKNTTGDFQKRKGKEAIENKIKKDNEFVEFPTHTMFPLFKQNDCAIVKEISHTDCGREEGGQTNKSKTQTINRMSRQKNVKPASPTFQGSVESSKKKSNVEYLCEKKGQTIKNKSDSLIKTTALKQVLAGIDLSDAARVSVVDGHQNSNKICDNLFRNYQHGRGDSEFEAVLSKKSKKRITKVEFVEKNKAVTVAESNEKESGSAQHSNNIDKTPTAYSQNASMSLRSFQSSFNIPSLASIDTSDTPDLVRLQAVVSSWVSSQKVSRQTKFSNVKSTEKMTTDSISNLFSSKQDSQDANKSIILTHRISSITKSQKIQKDSSKSSNNVKNCWSGDVLPNTDSNNQVQSNKIILEDRIEEIRRPPSKYDKQKGSLDRLNSDEHPTELLDDSNNEHERLQKRLDKVKDFWPSTQDSNNDEDQPMDRSKGLTATQKERSSNPSSSSLCFQQNETISAPSSNVIPQSNDELKEVRPVSSKPNVATVKPQPQINNASHFAGSEFNNHAAVSSNLPISETVRIGSLDPFCSFPLHALDMYYGRRSNTTFNHDTQVQIRGSVANPPVSSVSYSAVPQVTAVHSLQKSTVPYAIMPNSNVNNNSLEALTPPLYISHQAVPTLNSNRPSSVSTPHIQTSFHQHLTFGIPPSTGTGTTVLPIEPQAATGSFIHPTGYGDLNLARPIGSQIASHPINANDLLISSHGGSIQSSSLPLLALPHIPDYNSRYTIEDSNCIPTTKEIFNAKSSVSRTNPSCSLKSSGTTQTNTPSGSSYIYQIGDQNFTDGQSSNLYQRREIHTPASFSSASAQMLLIPPHRIPTHLPPPFVNSSKPSTTDFEPFEKRNIANQEQTMDPKCEKLQKSKIIHSTSDIQQPVSLIPMKQTSMPLISTQFIRPLDNAISARTQMCQILLPNSGSASTAAALASNPHTMFFNNKAIHHAPLFEGSANCPQSEQKSFPLFETSRMDFSSDIMNQKIPNSKHIRDNIINLQVCPKKDDCYDVNLYRQDRNSKIKHGQEKELLSKHCYTNKHQYDQIHQDMHSANESIAAIPLSRIASAICWPSSDRSSLYINKTS